MGESDIIDGPVRQIGDKLRKGTNGIALRVVTDLSVIYENMKIKMSIESQ